MEVQAQCLRFRTVAMSPIERAARELCRLDGLAPNINYEGHLMWQSFLPEVMVVLESLLSGATEQERAIIERWIKEGV